MELLDLQKYLQEKELYVEVGEGRGGIIMISIEWGDWKHEHMYCDYLMREKGYRLIDETNVVGNDSDCYSSTHIYKKFSLKDLVAQKLQ